MTILDLLAMTCLDHSQHNLPMGDAEWRAWCAGCYHDPTMPHLYGNASGSGGATSTGARREALPTGQDVIEQVREWVRERRAEFAAQTWAEHVEGGDDLACLLLDFLDGVEPGGVS